MTFADKLSEEYTATEQNIGYRGGGEMSLEPGREGKLRRGFDTPQSLYSDKERTGCHETGVTARPFSSSRDCPRTALGVPVFHP